MATVYGSSGTYNTMREIINLLEAVLDSSLVSIDDLPEETKEDICANIAERCPFWVQRNADVDEVREYLLGGLYPAIMLRRGYMRTEDLAATMTRRNSELAVQRYKTMITQGVEFDPILVANNKFLDGGHRLEAYMQAGRMFIPVVDISPLINADNELWEDWVEGKDVQLTPVR